MTYRDAPTRRTGFEKNGALAGHLGRKGRRFTVNMLLALVLACIAWLGFKLAFVPDDRLDIRLSVAADSAGQGEIRWQEQGRPFVDGWPISLTALQIAPEQAREVRVEILPVNPPGAVNPDALDNQVWFYNIATDTTPSIDWTQAYFDQNWKRERVPISADPSEQTFTDVMTTLGDHQSPFVYRARANNFITIPFLRGPWWEGAVIRIDGQEHVVNLDFTQTHSGRNEAVTFNLPHTLEQVGTITLPLPQNADQFDLQFNEYVTAVRLYAIQRSGRSSWIWQPGIPFDLDDGTLVSTTTVDYVELQVAPGGRLSLRFDHLPSQGYYYPRQYELLGLLGLATLLFMLLQLRTRLLRPLATIGNALATTLSAPPPEVRLGSLTWWILGLALIVRLKFALEDPVRLLLSDSYEYLTAAFWIRHGFSYALIPDMFDYRGPGYPAFLSAVFLVLNASYVSIVIAQLMLGLLTVFGGIRIGELLGNRWIGIAIGLYLALAPDQLWFEHTVLTETLALALVVWCCVLGLHFVREPNRLRWALLFGLCSTGIFYTRATLTLVAAFWLVLIGTRAIAALQRHYTRPTAHVALTIALIIALIVPWVLRNGSVYGQYRLMAGTNRALLIFWVWPHLLDTSLPRTAQFASTYYPLNAFRWDWSYSLGQNRVAGEAIARAIWREQIAAAPEAYLQRMSFAITNLLAITPGGELPGEPRLDVNFSPRTDSTGQYSYVFADEQIAFTMYGAHGVATQTLGWLWRQIIEPTRFTVFLLAMIAVSGFVIYWLMLVFRARPSTTDSFVGVVLTGLIALWLISIVFLAINLGHGPRYVMPFNWIHISVLAWVGALLARRAGAWYAHAPQNRPTVVEPEQRV